MAFRPTDTSRATVRPRSDAMVPGGEYTELGPRLIQTRNDSSFLLGFWGLACASQQGFTAACRKSLWGPQLLPWEP